MAGGANSAKHAVTDEPTGPSGDAASLPDIVPGLDRDADGDASRGDPAPPTRATRANAAITDAGMEQPFRVTFRGYDRNQVDHALAALTQRAELAERGILSSDALGARVTEILRLAATEAEQIRAAAEQDVERLRGDATRNAQVLRDATDAALVDLREQRAVILAQMSAARDDLTAILERGDVTEHPATPLGAQGIDRISRR